MSAPAAAVRTFGAISFAGISALSFMWQQRVGNFWSSMLIPAAPAGSIRRTIWKVLSALPHPVSPSVITGIETALTIDCTALTWLRIYRMPPGFQRPAAAVPNLQGGHQT
ncbi:hypothetical protein ABNQ39_26915 [Azospirillum sp. A26]|uniref:hypothetical protein n=1 Tax=Azospirillum sp. A26 TaxID=3160607 RepID=UPI003671D0A6